MKKQYFLILSFFFLLGCAHVIETAIEPVKVVWGSSTKALEDSRDTATVKTYACLPSACFDKVLEIIKGKETKEIKGTLEVNKTTEILVVKGYEIFIKDRKKNLIVVMGVPKSETTTEVGIFVTALKGKEKETKVEVVSLSSAAQATVSREIFQELDKAYPPIVKIPL